VITTRELGPTPCPRIKVCCIASVAEAWTAIRAGASALGLVSAMPSGPGVIADDTIARIASHVPPGIATFLLTSATDAETIVRQQRAARVNTLQLVDEVDPRVLREVRDALPGIAVVQVIHVRGAESVDEARRVASHVHAILLDSGNPAAAVKELGGTGRVHDWSVSAAIRQAVDVPVWLAGGLRAGNVAEAVRRVGPFGLDVCSGVRTDGVLDDAKLQAFIRAAAS
jgi:phosphoribosylanthranilate isomerase